VTSTPFHLAIPVHNIEAAREFFGGYVILFYFASTCMLWNPCLPAAQGSFL
jgi:hypothetical protein